MISATSARSASRRPAGGHRHHQGARRRGFTLIELLFVTVIIIVLASLSVPMILRSQDTARRTRIRAELQTIAMALEAYKADHGAYPRVEAANTGAIVLAQALVAPGPKEQITWHNTAVYNVGDYATDNNKHYRCIKANSAQLPALSPEFWLEVPPYWDGADGAGFRTRGTQGQVYGPYLDPEKFPLNDFGQIRDLFDNPILYFPAAASKPNIHSNAADGTPLYLARSGVHASAKQAMFDAADDGTWFAHGTDDGTANPPLWYRRLAVMLGDRDPSWLWDADTSPVPPATTYNGLIDSGETAAATGPFLLWSAGPDGLFGPEYDTAAKPAPDKADLAACDDITNFQ